MRLLFPEILTFHTSTASGRLPSYERALLSGPGSEAVALGPSLWPPAVVRPVGTSG